MEEEKTYQMYFPAFTRTEDGKITPYTCESENQEESQLRLIQNVGLKDWGSLKLLISNFLKSCCPSQEDQVTKLNEFFADLREFKPRDSLERKLFLQMTMVHEQILQAFQRCQHSTDDVYEQTLNTALKLLRIYSGQLEAVHKYRDAAPSVTTNLIANNAIVGGVVKCS